MAADPLAQSVAREDVHLLLDANGMIIEVEGAGQALLGYDDQALIGSDLQALVSPAEYGTIAQLLRILDAGGYAHGQPIAMADPIEGSEILIADCRPAADGRALAILRRPSAQERNAYVNNWSEGERALPVLDEFLDDISDLLTGTAQEPLDLTFVEVEGRLKQRWTTYTESTEGAGDALHAQLQSALRDHAIAGLAGQVSERGYGFLHSHDEDGDQIAENLRALARELGFDEQDLSFQQKTVRLDADNLARGDIDRAMHFALSRFVEGGTASLAFETLSRAHSQALEEEARRLAHLQGRSQSGGLRLRFSPIMDLRAERPVMIDCMTLTEYHGRLVSPQKLIDLCQDWRHMAMVDLAQIEAIFDLALSDESQQLPLLTRISCHSLVVPEFMEALQDLWLETDRLATRIALSLTDFDSLSLEANLQGACDQLIEAGHKIGLDAFEAALVDLPVLRALGLSHVRIRGRHSLALSRPGNESTLLAKLLSDWTGIGVEPIAEGLDDAQIVARLRDLGIRCGTGDAFGGWGGSIELNMLPGGA